MNKLIQAIVLTAVVFSPLSLLSLITSATAHHSDSHVSTISMESSIARKKKKNKLKAGKKPMTTGSTKKKPASADATTTPPETGMPSGVDSPMPNKPTPKPDISAPGAKVKPIDPTVDGSMTKPGTEMKIPTSGTPNVPTIPGGSTPTGVPSVKPTLPTLPTGLPK
jgi:hypothetical protein